MSTYLAYYAYAYSLISLPIVSVVCFADLYGLLHLRTYSLYCVQALIAVCLVSCVYSFLSLPCNYS